MPRSLVLGNGNLLVTQDKQLMIRDLYYPYVGMEDHTTYMHFHRIGVWVDNKISWLSNEHEWKAEVHFEQNTLAGRSESVNENLGLEICFRDIVHYKENIFLRKLTVKNKKPEDRKMRIFLYQDFHIYGDKLKDTSLYEPVTNSMIHYRKRRYFMVNGVSASGKGMVTYTTGKSEYMGYVGTWKDAEDGSLQRNSITQGSVDSTIGFELSLPADGEDVLYVWICAGKKFSEINHLNLFVQREKPEKMLIDTENYWHSWGNKGRMLIADTPLSEAVQCAFKQSLLIVRTQIDNRGAIIAANDNDIMKFNRDTYTYMWPRDGALVSAALDRAGYIDITKRFFEFCADIITSGGFFLHKYNPDKSLGSSWHPWFRDGKKQLPIQEDETALPLYALSIHYEKYKDLEYLKKIYAPLVKEGANFLHDFIYPQSKLPYPSYDLWEEHLGIHTFTCAAIYAGLIGAAKLAGAMGDSYRQAKYVKRADEIKHATLNYLWDDEKKRFLKTIKIDKDGNIIHKDDRVESSCMAVFYFNLLPADDARVVSTMKQMKERLTVKTPIGGLARFEKDFYHKDFADEKFDTIPGNPWYITTLWYAQWVIAVAKDVKSLREAEDILEWCVKYATTSYIMPEQLDPYTGEHVSVAPLTWSQATYVETVLKYQEKVEAISATV